MRAPRAYQSIGSVRGARHGTRGDMINSVSRQSARYFDLDAEHLVDLFLADRTFPEDERVRPGEVDDGGGDVLATKPTVEVHGHRIPELIPSLLRTGSRRMPRLVRAGHGHRPDVPEQLQRNRMQRHPQH